jgi:RNA polymerase sigma-70 factor (ECF subfamily)
MLGNEHDPRDLAQETFVRVYQARHGFRPGQPFGVWLFTIAANLARNHLRWRSRHPDIPLDGEPDAPKLGLRERLAADTATPGEAAEAAERAAAVRSAVQALPSDLREPVVLCEWEERTVAEAAAVLRTTPKAVESRLYRARHLLRERLKRWL